MGMVDTEHTQHDGGDETKIIRGSDYLVEGLYSAYSYALISCRPANSAVKFDFESSWSLPDGS